MAKVLITGANSFIGSNFIKYSRAGEVSEISVADIDPARIDFNNCDSILHLAAIVHQPKKNDDPEYFRINRDLSISVAQAAKRAGVRQFVFMSTVKVYGDANPANGILNEESPCFPQDAYGKSKYEAEKALLALSDEKFIVSIVRTPIVYGPGMKANMLRMVKLIEKFPVLPFGKIDNRRNLSYVENLIGYIDRIIELRATGIFISMDTQSISTTQLTELIAKYLGKTRYLITLGKFPRRVLSKLAPDYFDRLYGSLEFDNTITRMKLNYQPVYSVFDGLKRTIESYIEEGIC